MNIKSLRKSLKTSKLPLSTSQQNLTKYCKVNNFLGDLNYTVFTLVFILRPFHLYFSHAASFLAIFPGKESVLDSFPPCQTLPTHLPGIKTTLEKKGYVRSQ